MPPKLKLLLFTDWFSPAFKAGGPVRSVVNLVDRFKEEYDMFVFTSDRDLNDTNPFDDIVADEWIARDGIHIYYYSPGKMSYALVKSTISDIAPDKIYLNSMFSNMILPIRAAYQSGKIVLAPRGMLRPSALAVKPIRKFFYLSLLKLFSVERSITFHSTGVDETKNIKRIFPLATKIIEAPNLPVPVSGSLVEHLKEVGAVKLIFVGRIHPIKNLLVLLEALEKVKGDIHLTIIATLEDLTYWEKCNVKIQALQEQIQINVMIDLPHHEIKQHIEQAHFFVLPTEGENFGHAIFEALAVGCPIIISDQTPWRNLASQKAGFDLSLQDLNSFSNAIQSCIDMDNDVWQEYRHGAWNEAKRYSAEMNPELSYFQLFNT